MDGNKRRVFVCSEVNHHELVIECGEVNALTVIESEDTAYKWVCERIKEGECDGFIKDRDYDYSEENVKNEIADGFFTITMFREYQENWNESFDITVERKEIIK